MKSKFKAEIVSTDQYFSVSINNNIDDKNWDIIKQSVAMGYLYPNINVNNPDHLPYKEGSFRLAYILSPHYKLLPRKGKSIPLNKILISEKAKSFQMDLNIYLDDSGEQEWRKLKILKI